MLYLIPNSLQPEVEIQKMITLEIKEVMSTLDGVIAENAKTARAYLKHFVLKVKLPDFKISILDEHTKKVQIPDLLLPLEKGETWGLISDAGCPAVADPGADFVYLAHQKGIKVKPLVGPSSILLALMGSGLNGQNFAFNGYLPIEKNERIWKIRTLESLALKSGQTQIFMETPYRNDQLFSDLLGSLKSDTLL